MAEQSEPVREGMVRDTELASEAAGRYSRRVDGQADPTVSGTLRQASAAGTSAQGQVVEGHGKTAGVCCRLMSAIDEVRLGNIGSVGVD